MGTFVAPPSQKYPKGHRFNIRGDEPDSLEIDVIRKTMGDESIPYRAGSGEMFLNEARKGLFAPNELISQIATSTFGAPDMTDAYAEKKRGIGVDPAMVPRSNMAKAIGRIGQDTGASWPFLGIPVIAGVRKAKEAGVPLLRAVGKELGIFGGSNVTGSLGAEALEDAGPYGEFTGGLLGATAGSAGLGAAARRSEWLVHKGANIAGSTVRFAKDKIGKGINASLEELSEKQRKTMAAMEHRLEPLANEQARQHVGNMIRSISDSDPGIHDRIAKNTAKQAVLNEQLAKEGLPPIDLSVAELSGNEAMLQLFRKTGSGSAESITGRGGFADISTIRGEQAAKIGALQAGTSRFLQPLKGLSDDPANILSENLMGAKAAQLSALESNAKDLAEIRSRFLSELPDISQKDTGDVIRRIVRDVRGREAKTIGAKFDEFDDIVGRSTRGAGSKVGAIPALGLKKRIQEAIGDGDAVWDSRALPSVVKRLVENPGAYDEGMTFADAKSLLETTGADLRRMSRNEGINLNSKTLTHLVGIKDELLNALDNPNLPDKELADRYRSMRGEWRDFKQTFDRELMDDLRKTDAVGDFTTKSSEIVKRVLSSEEDARQFKTAIGANPAAMTNMRVAILDRFRDAATAADGSLSPSGHAAFVQRHAKQLRELGLYDELADKSRAASSINEATSRALDRQRAFNSDTLMRQIGNKDPDELVEFSLKRRSNMAETLKNLDRDGAKALAQASLERFTKPGQSSADALAFMADHEEPLKMAFTKAYGKEGVEHFKKLKLAAEIQNMAVDMSGMKIPADIAKLESLMSAKLREFGVPGSQIFAAARAIGRVGTSASYFLGIFGGQVMERLSSAGKEKFVRYAMTPQGFKELTALQAAKPGTIDYDKHMSNLLAKLKSYTVGTDLRKRAAYSAGPILSTTMQPEEQEQP
jgi:hypothetical protein